MLSVFIRERHHDSGDHGRSLPQLGQRLHDLGRRMKLLGHLVSAPAALLRLDLDLHANVAPPTSRIT